MNKLLVIGSLNMDMVIHVPSIPRAGETLMGTLHGYIPGGKGANQAIAGGRMGPGTAMIGLVGRDQFGERLLDGLKEAGVDAYGVSVCPEPTGQAVISVSADGENSIIVLPGANERCDVSYIKDHEAQIAQSRVVLLQMEIPHPAVFEAIRLAKKHGCTVVLNTAPAPESLPDEVYPMLDYLCPNETELSRLSGLPVNDPAQAETAARALLDRGAAAVLATLGKNGALLVNREGALRVPGFSVKTVDTTAAGDTFCATFCRRLADGEPIKECIRFANAAAALSVTRPGAQSSIPTLEETAAFLRAQEV